jgi:hypothetical protein
MITISLQEYNELKEKVAYVEKMGVQFGIMKTSDCPGGYLAHTWHKDSDHERMFQEWSDSIGWEDTVKKLKDEIKELEDENTELKFQLEMQRDYGNET